MAIKPYLQLVRLPNVFTAAADSLAGWLLVSGSFANAERWLPLVGASMAIYAAGIALNDLCDIEIDRAERPNRPLPSGRVGRRFALVLVGVLLAGGLALAALSGSLASVAVAGLLVACVLLYDLGGKRTVLGPEVMGACRGLNVLLGMSQAPELGGPSGWLVAGALAAFVAGVTWISRSEARGGPLAGVASGMIVQNVAILCLMAAALRPKSFPLPDLERPALPAEAAGVLVLAAVLWVVNLADARALRDRSPAAVQRAVKTGVLSLVWLNVGVVAGVRGPAMALVVAALWVPAFVLSRWLYTT
jgi:4-hydroxybenzoate polyprenyltransferase